MKTLSIPTLPSKIKDDDLLTPLKKTPTNNNNNSVKTVLIQFDVLSKNNPTEG